MTRSELFKLYDMEREYQEETFGEYKQNPSLNVASFLLFLDNYIQKAKKYYVSRWTADLPVWLIATKESIDQGTCPVDTYDQLIKIFALAGAALESYAAIDSSRWREGE